MPWTSADAPKHTRDADNEQLRRIWAATANNALKEYDGDEGRAVSAANAAVNRQRKGARDTLDEILPLLDVAGLAGRGIKLRPAP